jgi:hypothetical protein
MICVICGYEILGFGNNALPVKDGQCCGMCNDTVVIPKRLANVFEMQTKENKNDQEEK